MSEEWSPPIHFVIYRIYAILLPVKRTQVDTIKIGRQQLELSQIGYFPAQPALQELGVDLPESGVEFFLEGLGVDIVRTDFENGKHIALDSNTFTRLAFTLETPEAKRWQNRAQKMMREFLEGDIKLAAEIADRNRDSNQRRWLATRLTGMESRKALMSTVARNGGRGAVFQQLGSVSNRAVLGTSSTELRRERHAKSTRDAMTSAELLRLGYLEAATAQAIERGAASDNEAILQLHRRNAEIERQIWEGSGRPEQAA
ncbi:MAG: DNA damage response protein DdrC [Pleurocapsa sp. SU_196_0]|nr:DNA damage response protein DdrC [Pleurocapsa sp. SU_196_0]